MKCEDVADRLDEFVAGDLGPESEARIRSHVADCDACAAELEAIRELAARVAGLPSSIEPQRDLWPGIAARIEERKVARVTFGRSTRRALLAAAVVVAAVGSVLIAYTIGRQQAKPLVVRVEVGVLRMLVRDWLRLRPGDVIQTGHRIAEPVVLRVAGQEIGRGELVNVEGELGVRIRELTKGEALP